MFWLRGAAMALPTVLPSAKHTATVSIIMLAVLFYSSIILSLWNAIHFLMVWLIIGYKWNEILLMYKNLMRKLYNLIWNNWCKTTKKKLYEIAKDQNFGFGYWRVGCYTKGCLPSSGLRTLKGQSFMYSDILKNDTIKD